jgi:CubicO group peptidase (beta-lactamase class C family)
MPAAAQELSTAEQAGVDSSVRGVLGETEAPSASIAVVRNGRIVYEKAYGRARIEPNVPANPSIRYPIGSVSKQFIATAILLLSEDGKLTLEDKVAKWFPQLTRAADISVGELLSMTSGYQDYWPQDYVFPDMRRPATPESIIERWAGKPLDFEPGTQWQYSNTNYVIAGAVVERVAGRPLMDFLRKRIFQPLEMTSVFDINPEPLPPSDAGGYLRYALGPLRPAPKEAAGWLFGAGQLAMTAHELALWDIAMIKQSVLRPESYREQQTDTLLEAGNATGYGLGVFVDVSGGRRRIFHGGAVSGYTAINQIYPDDGAAIVVLINMDGGPTSEIAGKIADIIFAETAAANANAVELARKIYDGLSRGTIDHSQFTPAAIAYFTPEVLSDYAKSLAPLGQPIEFELRDQSLRGGMTIRRYGIRAGSVLMRLTTMTLPDGRFDQYIIARDR